MLGDGGGGGEGILKLTRNGEKGRVNGIMDL